MLQKVIQIGNSSGIIFPKEVLKKLRIKKDSLVDIEFDEQKVSIVKKGYKETKPSVSPELLAWLDRFNARYKYALQELAKK